MPKSTVRSVLKLLAIVSAIVLIAAVVWASQPFVDRSEKAANPVPLNRAPDALSADKTARLIDFIQNDAAGTDSLVVLKNGQVIFEYGPTDVPSNLHSGRKMHTERAVWHRPGKTAN